MVRQKMNPFAAFLSGWKDKGASPDVSPTLVIPYHEVIARYLEDAPRRSTLEEAIIEHEDSLPFEFTYDVFPFVVANFCARSQFANQSPKFEFIERSLESLLHLTFSAREEPDLRDVIVNPQEQAFLPSGTSKEYPDLALFALRHRSEFMREVFLKESIKHFGHEGGFRQLLKFSSQDFLFCATGNRSVEGFEAVEAHVAQTFDDFFYVLGQFS